MAFERITVNPDRLAGVPCIRDLRFPVATVVLDLALHALNSQLATQPNADNT